MSSNGDSACGMIVPFATVAGDGVKMKLERARAVVAKADRAAVGKWEHPAMQVINE